MRERKIERQREREIDDEFGRFDNLPFFEKSGISREIETFR